MAPDQSPALFPDRLDPENRLVRFAPTTRAILAQSAFLDGRTPLSPPGVEAIVRPLGEGASAPLRWILHESFCGSTLLARMTGVAAHAFVLREPQILVDCANHPDPAAIAGVRGLLARRWAVDEPIVVKPSNWINPALPALLAPGDRTIVATIATEPFLVAVLRGGRDRIAYALRLYEAFARAWPGLAAQVAEAELPAGDAMAVASGMVAALHWMQRAVLDAHAPGLRLAFPDFLGDPAAAVAAVRTALDLAPAAGDAAATLAIHAKSTDRPADRDAETRANAAVRAHHCDVIGGALALHARLDAMDPVRGDARDGG